MVDKIEIENFNTPGKTVRVDKEKYLSMRTTLLAILPAKPPGINQNQMMTLVKTNADQRLWPRGEKSSWWVKTVQLDLEAKSQIKRLATKPLTWVRS